ncbi:TraU family protein [Proteus mirabilis]
MNRSLRQNVKPPCTFFYADAIGHPATTLIGGSIPGYSCDSAATPLFPYYLSTLDSVPWRLGVPEMAYPEAIIPGKRKSGAEPGQHVGNLYPRSGFVNQQDGDKAAAVVAQRVADIMTRTGQAHTYVPLEGNRRMAITAGRGDGEYRDKNHKWQRLSPGLKTAVRCFRMRAEHRHRTVIMPGHCGSRTAAASAWGKNFCTAQRFKQGF